MMIGSLIRDYFNEAQSSIFIFSPFISNSSICKLIGNCRNVVIVTSWREDHLLSGVSSISLYPLCVENGWTLYIKSNLHAKIYSNDLKDCYVGSANCTESALFSANGNVECMYYVECLSDRDKFELQHLINQSILVDKELYQSYEKWMEQQTQTKKINCTPLPVCKSYKIRLFDLPNTCSPRTLYKYVRERPNERNSGINHDVWLYCDECIGDEEEWVDYCRESFFSNSSIMIISRWIDSNSEGVPFGGLSRFIRNNCSDTILPERNDFKDYVTNIMIWFTELKPYEYEIIVPNYRSVLKRIYQ